MQQILKVNIWDYVDIEKLNEALDDLFYSSPANEGSMSPSDITYTFKEVDKKGNCEIEVDYIIEEN